jgi:hypothetical protein
MMRILIKEIASHRNGCFGEPFHAVRFTSDGELLLGMVFEGEGRVAVIDPARAVDSVLFGENSYRGDVYEPALRAAVASWEAAREADFHAPRTHNGLRVIYGGRALESADGGPGAGAAA